MRLLIVFQNDSGIVQSVLGMQKEEIKFFQFLFNQLAILQWQAILSTQSHC